MKNTNQDNFTPNNAKKWTEAEINRLHKRFIARACIVVPLISVVIFLLAGRIDYWQGWGFSIPFFISKLVEVSNKELVVERAHPSPELVVNWDKLFFTIYIPFSFAIIIIGSLDTGRYYWSPVVPWYAYLIGYCMYLSAIGLTSWAMRTNKFFSSMVRIHTDRGHHVIETGPYRFIRHPGY